MANQTLSANEKLDLLNTVNSLSAKLHALLCNAYGEAGESFRGLNDELQDSYLWACTDIAAEIKAAAFRL